MSADKISKMGVKRLGHTTKTFLGNVTGITDLKRISEVAHVPMHFLKETHMVEYDSSKDVIKSIKNVKKKTTLEENISHLKSVFLKIYKIIIARIEEDEKD